MLTFYRFNSTPETLNLERTTRYIVRMYNWIETEYKTRSHICICFRTSPIIQPVMMNLFLKRILSKLDGNHEFEWFLCSPVYTRITGHRGFLRQQRKITVEFTTWVHYVTVRWSELGYVCVVHQLVSYYGVRTVADKGLFCWIVDWLERGLMSMLIGRKRSLIKITAD